MASKKKFDKKYWFSIFLSILLFFIGFFAGRSYVINGDYTELQNEYTLLNSSYNKLIVQSSQGNIITQNQQGNNLLVNQEKPARKLDANLKRNIDNILVQYKGNKVFVDYLHGNSEVYNFVNEIIEYLEQKGYEVNVFPTIHIDSKMEGQSAYINDENILTFSIGDRI